MSRLCARCYNPEIYEISEIICLLIAFLPVFWRPSCCRPQQNSTMTADHFVDVDRVNILFTVKDRRAS